MTIRKGDPWSRPAGAGADISVDGDDAALACAVAENHTPRVAWNPTPSADFARSVSATGVPATTTDGIELPCDALRVHADLGSAGWTLLAVNMVVAGTAPDRRRRWTRSARVRVCVDDRIVHDGPATAVVIGNGQFLRGADLIPRGHPGDGRAEVQVYSVAPRERALMRSRLPQGAHVPHPGIRQSAGRRIEVTTSSHHGWRTEVDGVRRGTAARLEVEVLPEAFLLVV